MTSLIQYPCNIDYLQCISSRGAILPPKITDLCNINRNRTREDFALNRYRRDFKSLWGPNGTKMVILTNRIDVRDSRSGPAEFLAGLDETHCRYCKTCQAS